MVPGLRESFNRQFTAERYQEFLGALDAAVGTRIQFRVAETPVFVPRDLLGAMQSAALDLIRQLDTPAYRSASARAVPPEFAVPHEDDHPVFIVVDFAVTRDPSGALVPRLIEMQGFPSLFGFQVTMPKVFRAVYDLNRLGYLLSGLDEAAYISLVRRAICGNHDPANVVLMDIQPGSQKTLPDFLCTEKMTGIKAVCITEIIRHGKKLFYRREGEEIPIHRIYNRAIIDELVRTGVTAAFDFRDELEVEWAGHPNWYFRWSKFSLPYLKHETVPRAWFLDEVETYPPNLSEYVLKPLFSFAGAGVSVDVTREQLDAVPWEQRHGYLLQEKVSYGAVIRTPDEPSKVEIRMMYIWLDRPVSVTTLARLSKGKMMGVDFNKNKDWVGSSCCLFEEG